MFGIENIMFFITATIIITMTPGTDTIFVINKSISKGKRAAIYTTFGIITGLMVHTTLSAFGLSAIIAQSVVAYSIIKYLGALYLVYLGIKSLMAKNSQLEFSEQEEDRESRWESFRGGVITNILNPKVALFFLSFFPQFIKKEYMESPLPFLMLGIICAIIGLVWFILLGYFSALFANKFKENPKFNIILNKISGIVFILMGIKVALDK